MSEMLGNYHFITRNYSSALIELESSIIQSPADFYLRKKLIICYTQTNNLLKALELFLSLVKENIDCIVEIGFEEEYCPCHNLIADLERGTIKRIIEYELLIELGILWLYCDITQSLNYFLKVQQINQNDSRINQIVRILESKMEKKSKRRKSWLMKLPEKNF
ncbi:MAG: hypothetical protein M1495_14125 [Bacteroidetes bacterium]|nr:hypothetical protein [Bacteroidota bacterium]MCL6098999.1 hypothetical protein [Bacteroidota bacterium]